MRIEALTEIEYERLLRVVQLQYPKGIPRTLQSALFINVVSDSERRFHRLERKIQLGIQKLDRLLALKDPYLHRKLFVD
jgi:hypothetical protein